uniref:Uncharacterized protein n=1 Tax=Caenorhabditis japonica TaxID=281687 RepID=A0A8R1I584_CAEJA
MSASPLRKMDDAATLATKEYKKLRERGLCFALISRNLTPNACAIHCSIGANLQRFIPNINTLKMEMQRRETLTTKMLYMDLVRGAANAIIIIILKKLSPGDRQEFEK